MKEKDFDDQVVEFRARMTNNGFDDFITFFGERDVEVRCLNKMVQGRTKEAGYHSPTSRRPASAYIDNKVNTVMANLVAAVEAAMVGRVLDSSATSRRPPIWRTSSPPALRTPS